MLSLFFRFYGDLNDFLPPEQRHREICHTINEPAAVKHPVESIGVPHPEVGAILVNGQATGFAHLVGHGDRVQVFPWTEAGPGGEGDRLRPPLPRPVRFALDTHLGQLAHYLRLLGFDTLYRNDYTDHELARIAADEDRVLLTRDRGLLKHRIVVHGHCVRETAPREQVISVLRRFELSGAVDPWCRCLRCNGLLAPVAKAAVIDQLEPKTRLYYDEFQRCTQCGRVYWQGSHFERLERFIAEVVEAAQSGDRSG